MKRVLTTAALVFAFLVSFAAIAFGAASTGSCTQAVSYTQNPTMVVLEWTCTADASDGSFPATIALTSASAAAVEGLSIFEVRTKPGTTQPTTLYDITINDAYGVDLMGGVLADRSATAGERALAKLNTSVYGGVPLLGTETVTITHNSVTSAIIYMKWFCHR